MGKKIIKNPLPTNELDSVFAGRQGRVLKVSTAELNGIRSILANPKPPTPELTAAWKDYLCHTADTPDSNE